MSAHETQRLLLVGATGLVGRHVLAQALADASVAQVVAPTRRALPAHPRLLNPVVDFDALPRDAAWWQVNAVVCALGTTIRDAGSEAAFRRVDFDYVLAVGQRARRHGARAFAGVSSLGADPASRSFYLRTKGEMEQALQALDYPSLTLVRPSVIGGDRDRHRLLEHLSMRVLQALAPVVPRRYRVAPAERIAGELLAAVQRATPGCEVVESERLQDP